VDVETTPDGGFVLIDASRLRRVSHDGRLRTLAGSGSGIDEGQLSVLTGEPSVAGFYNGEGGDPRLAKLRRPIAAARDPLGAWLIADSENGVSMLAGRRVQRMGVALSGGNMASERLDYIATAAGRATLALRHDGRTVGTTRGATRPGRNSIRLPRVPPGIYVAVLRAKSNRGFLDQDRLGVLLGGLSRQLARSVILSDPIYHSVKREPRARVADAATEYVGRCHGFGRRRADCVIRDVESDACVHVLSVRLDTRGLLWQRSYGCKRRGFFQERPRGLSKRSPLPFL
jgi:hypothetical protein